jgi:ribose-phosphate pyrophosphokinase
MLKSLAIFSGSANVSLTDEICNYLEVPMGRSKISRFSDGETCIEIGENVRGVNCFVVQPTCHPVNEHLMELLVTIDALRRSSAGSIIAIIPYFGYARQDRKVKPRTPITAKLVADLISAAGADRVLSMDLHAGQIQGFFNIPVDHLYAMPILLQELVKHFRGSETVVVSPDAGGVERARAFSKRLEASLAIIDKRRPQANQAEVMNVIGDVKGKDAILVDDMIDTAGTLTKAAAAVMSAGARTVNATATHGVLSGPAVERIQESGIAQVYITNTVPLSPAAQACEKIHQLSVARLLGEAIKRIHHGDSISSLFV